MSVWSTRGYHLLPGLSPRPQQHIYGIDGGEELVKSSHHATFVFMKDCRNARVIVKGKVGKILVENGLNLIVYVLNPVVGGIVEVIRCDGLTIKLGIDSEVPVLQIDDSSGIKVRLLKKSQLHSIYYIRSYDIAVLLESDTDVDKPNEEQAQQFLLDNTSGDAEIQKVGHWDSYSSPINFVSELAVRDGIYPSTAQLIQAAKEREERAMNNMVSMIMRSIRMEKPNSAPLSSSVSSSVLPKGITQTSDKEMESLSHQKPAPSKPRVPEDRYGRQHDEEKKEYFDTVDVLEEKVTYLADWLRECDHCIVFTGAGISTSTGIPDFRSGMNTVLKTGPGAWELRDKAVARPKGSQIRSTLQAIPSVTHMALVELQRRGIIKFVVSQNTDGLHLRSGLDPRSLAELHGNSNLEKCERCGSNYLRDFSTRSNRSVHDHSTGRICPDPTCGGELLDSIINFGENLPVEELEAAYAHAAKADLCLSLGSSLTVSPANEIPAKVLKRGQRLAIVNLQKTPLHSQCSLALFAMCDDVMRALMNKLDIPIPEWRLRRRVFTSVTLDSKKCALQMAAKGLDMRRSIPYSLFTTVDFSCGVREYNSRVSKNCSTEPFNCTLTLPLASEGPEIWYRIQLAFAGHYAEPNFTLSGVAGHHGVPVEKEYVLSYEPSSRVWEMETERIV